MKQIVALIAGGLWLAALSGCGKGEAEEARAVAVADTIPVEVLRLEPRSFTEYGEYYGKVSGIREATLVNVAGGRVASFAVKIGSSVREGTSLGSIDADKASTLLETARLNEKVARENYERMRKHLESGNASQLQVDQMQLAWLTAKSNRIDAERMYEGALCITPISGTVVSRLVELDQELAPGTPTFAVAQLHRMKVSVGVPESDMAGVAVNHEATVTFDTYPGREWKGRVSSFSQQPSPSSRKYTAEIEIDNRDKAVLSGMTARVRLALRTRENQIVVPTPAVQTVGLENSVMLVRDGRALKAVVRAGPTDESSTVILEGLAPGADLVVAGQHLVTTGSPVKVMN